MEMHWDESQIEGIIFKCSDYVTKQLPIGDKVLDVGLGYYSSPHQ